MEWQISSGPQIVNGGQIKNVVKNSQEEIFYLLDEGPNRNIKLFHSSDFGVSFNAVYAFGTSNLKNLALASHPESQDIFIIEQLAENQSRLLKWNHQNSKVEIQRTNSSIGFGNDGLANLDFNIIGNQIILHSYDHQNKFYQSTDLGLTWTFLSNLPAKPWDDGIFISQSNPDFMVLSEVDAHRSLDGGMSWERINHWYDYYLDPVSNLHADMMHIFESQVNGENKIFIANHGGINVSHDFGINFTSIAQEGLNISQYYDVKTYPHDPSYLFAASQDQGIQRSRDLGEGPGFYTQMLSGDYGHITFTNQGRSLWTVYPGGQVYFLENPISSTQVDASYYPHSPNPNAWIPPLINSPYHHNSVILAGGGTQFLTGSYLVELKILDLGQLSEQLWPYNFGQNGASATGMAYNNFRSNEFYVITSNGEFFKSIDGGIRFEQKRAGLSNANYLYGTKILSSKSEPNVLFISGSGYSNSPIFRSDDAGESFYSIKYNLPKTTVFDLDIDSNGDFLFAATEAGPYVLVMKDQEWHELSQGIAPNQTYWSVEYLEMQNKIRFGSFGRGLWDINLEFLSHHEEIISPENVMVYPNPSSGIVNISSTEKLKLKLINSQGQVVKDFQIDAGTTKIELNAYPNGIYYVIFENKNHSGITQLIKL